MVRLVWTCGRRGGVSPTASSRGLSDRDQGGDRTGSVLYNELVTLFCPDVDLVFYDLTSSYFEGEAPELAEHGYSRDQAYSSVCR